MSEQGTTTMRIRETAEETTGAVREQVAETKEKGVAELRTQIDDRTTRIGRQASSLAQELRRSGDSLQATDSGTARLTSGVADRLEKAGNYLERIQGDDLLRDAENFARRQPWLVAGAAAVAGFAASRLLKASSERRYDPSFTSRSYDPQTWDSSRQQSLTSDRYADPPTVTVGPADMASGH